MLALRAPVEAPPGRGGTRLDSKAENPTAQPSTTRKTTRGLHELAGLWPQLTPADQAEAYFLLISQRLSKTTGQVITVDGGLHEAFLR